MSDIDRERRLADTFVALADTLVRDYDITDLLYMLVDRSAELLDAEDASILLAGDGGDLAVVAATSDRARSVGHAQIVAGEGPCVDAYTDGVLITVESIADSYARWPGFAVEASSLGYQSTHAIPMRLRERVIGSLNLYRDTPGPLNQKDALAGQSLADVATIGILQARAIREAGIVEDQLKMALDSRIVIEQAKGALIARRGLTPADAFSELRSMSRNSGRRLTDVAREVLAMLAPGSS